MVFLDYSFMNNSSNSCSSCSKFSLWVTLLILAILAILFIASSMNVFGESAVIIPNEATEPSCAESGSCFLTSELTVSVGETITWHNDSSVIHTVTSGSFEDGPDRVFDSSIIMSGDTFTHTFTETGQYEYFCSIHPWMTGTVIVV